MPRINNEVYSNNCVPFLIGCELAGITGSPRQAAKFRRREGAARVQWDAIVLDKTRKPELDERMIRVKACVDAQA